MSPSKKQKCPNCEVEDEGNDECETILDILPPEVLELILMNLSYHEIAQTIRLVSKRFQVLATTILNNAFLIAGVKLKTVERQLMDQILTVKGADKVLLCHRTHNASELIRAQYQMLKAVTWRYTHPIQRHKFVRLCFYAGSILDTLFKFIALLKSNPCAPNDLHESKPITEFIGLCKTFMNHFEKVSERKVNKSGLVSGCKTIDILDCLVEGREVQSYRVCDNRGKNVGKVCMTIKYNIKRSWFTCFQVANLANENSWKDEQRFMYLRLRRLVSSVNIHLYENEHYATEQQLKTPLVPGSRPPPVSTYSGYGEYGGKFFYYGNMNKYAYDSKVKASMYDIDSETDDENYEQQEHHDKSSFDLVIVANIRCSPELAPLAVKPLLHSDYFDAVTPVSNEKKLELYLKLDVTCPASFNNRLPGHFVWELNVPKRGRR